MNYFAIIAMISAFTFVSCETAEDLSPEEVCTLLGWTEALSITHTPFDQSNKTKIRLDGIEVQSCQDTFPPCLRSLQTKAPIEIVTLSLPMNQPKDQVDIDILSLDSSDEISNEKNYSNVVLNWQDNLYPNGAPMCGVASLSQVDLRD